MIDWKRDDNCAVAERARVYASSMALCDGPPPRMYVEGAARLIMTMAQRLEESMWIDESDMPAHYTPVAPRLTLDETIVSLFPMTCDSGW